MCKLPSSPLQLAVEEHALKCLALGINTVDSFDIHGQIVDLRRSLDAAARQHNAVSIISAGWDPELLRLRHLASGLSAASRDKRGGLLRDRASYLRPEPLQPPSPLVFLLISTHFTATLGIPLTSPTL